MNPSDRIDERYPFALSEVAYRTRDRAYYPTGAPLDAIRRTVSEVLGPLREACGLPIYILRGGGFDPLRDPESGVWVSHRKSGTTKHHAGGALDFRIGSAARAKAWPRPWSLMSTYRWVESRLADLGIPGGLGLYDAERNRFIHVDLRTFRARWGDKE